MLSSPSLQPSGTQWVVSLCDLLYHLPKSECSTLISGKNTIIVLCLELSVGFFSTFKTPLCAAPPPFSTPLYCFRPPDTGLLGLSPPSPNLRTRFLDPSMSLLSMATSPSTVIDLSPSFSTVSNCTSYPRSRLLDLSPPASSTSLNPPPLSGWISTLDRAAGGHSNRQRHLGLEEGLEVHMNNGASRW